MGKSTTSSHNLRLLTIALRESTPALELATFAALPGFDWIGDVADCNEGLRQTLMTQPDVIVMPWSATMLKLLRALVHLRHQGLCPLVVAVIPETPQPEIPPRDGVVTIGQEQIDDRLADRLHRLSAVLALTPDPSQAGQGSKP